MTVFASAIFNDQFGSPAMRRIFSDANWAQKWLDVEAALARVEARVGLIPAASAAIITERAWADRIDFAALRTRYDLVGYPILPLIQEFAAQCGEAAAHLHWGATTQDITDTGFILQLRQADDVIAAELRALRLVAGSLAEAHRGTVMAGRTHGQHALPVTFGLKAAIWAAELGRHEQRLVELRPRLFVLSLSGAAGTLASLGADGPAVREGLAAELGLHLDPLSCHTARDGLAEFAALLGMAGSTIERIAHEIEMLQKSEFGELAEAFQPGHGASSAMPQKHNPVHCETIIALGRMLRQNVVVTMESMVQEHERDWWAMHLEWKSLSESCLMLGCALERMRGVLSTLQVFPERMRANLVASHGLIMAEAVMLELGRSIGRDHAHHLVYACCRRAVDGGQDLAVVLAADPAVAQHLDPARIARLLDPAGYLGLAALPTPVISPVPPPEMALPIAVPATAGYWRAEFEAFAAADRRMRPPTGGIVFTGSSSIRLWSTLARDFPGRAVLNRGFGGCGVVDCARHADVLVGQYRPAVVILYAGGNEIASGWSAEAVAAEVSRFCELVHVRLPQARVAVIEHALQPARQAHWGTVRRLNQLQRAFMAMDPRRGFIAIGAPLSGDSDPDPAYFVADRIHLSPPGYAVWTRAVSAWLGRIA